MTNVEKLQLLLRRTMAALGPYREDVVFIGGFAKTFYRHLPGFRDHGLVPQATLDVDLALPEPLLLRENASLHLRLEEQGLRRYVGLGLDNRPAFHRYHLMEDGIARPAVVHLEFIVPLRGPDRETPGHPQADLLAHALRFIDLLQDQPVTVVDPEFGSLRLPHPLAYAIQKTRIWRDRRDKANRDQADAFYVIFGLQANWSAWRNEWLRLSQNRPEWARWLATTQQHWREQYRTPDSPGGRTVALITGMDPLAVHRIMADFIKAVCQP
jgi:hypothetical protein